MAILFKDRKDAGSRLASKLLQYKDRKDVIVLALPRGGVVTGYEVARILNCPLDVIIIKKIGFPGQEELAIGAVSETGAMVLNENIVLSYGISKDYIENQRLHKQEEISRRIALYRGGKGIPPLDGKVIILVDDGIATGATIKVAIAVLKKEKISRLVVAVPVASPDAEESIKKIVDEWVCLETPHDLRAIGYYYEDFDQVSDEEVIKIMKTNEKEQQELRKKERK